MRFSFVALPLSILVAGSSASTIHARQLPSCAVSCTTSSNINYGNCSTTDDACLCQDTSFVTSVETCINSNCSGSDLQTALSEAQALCAAAGVTLTSEAVSATSTSPGSSSSSGSGAGSSPASTSASASASATSTTSASNGALTVGANAFAGLTAIGFVALAL
ncbi:uncharacterized protein BT62DRAFT_920554 [Guyanagaster necrorhizus]|uniref:CFEM domain-containing protein n=1 Tax=Guyanagaster necrorhizus TaxID=856835 RepID=A0A9P7VR50_9AGAR|nr:uncharacterized protein BT62DRAFT_920554 [Guyanagaster necrorhizus MCA 3950]KAG7445292.1 hypothetical protein BT62DRAFT_920554 [Guyanagaster necrorhizus MCA 3950]